MNWNELRINRLESKPYFFEGLQTFMQIISK